jgi:hypothetical protein
MNPSTVSELPTVEGLMALLETWAQGQRICGVKIANCEPVRTLTAELQREADAIREYATALAYRSRSSDGERSAEPSPVPADEREAFEAAMGDNVSSLYRAKVGGGYLYADAQRAWEAWQARAALNAAHVLASPSGWMNAEGRVCSAAEKHSMENHQGIPGKRMAATFTTPLYAFPPPLASLSQPRSPE